MDFKFPDVGEGIHEGVIVNWLVKEGDHVAVDDVLCEIETDKAVVEIPSPEAGKINKIYHQEGETVKVGEVLVSYESDQAASVPKDAEPKNEVPQKTGGVVGAVIDADSMPKNSGPLFDNLNRRGTDARTTTTHNTDVKILPAVRKLAQQLGVDISTITPTGNRITKEDIEKAAANKPSSSSNSAKPTTSNFGEIIVEPLSAMRKAITVHLKKTHDSVIPVTQTHYCDVTALNEYRKNKNESLTADGVKLSYLPYICCALIAATQEFPRFNAEYDAATESLLLKQFVNIAIAVDSPEGLYVPVVQNAEKMTITEISKEIALLAAGVRDGSIDKKKLSGSSITISNYGSVGTVIASPIINYPNTCILGIGAIQKTPQLENGQLVEKLILPLSLTYDHRFNDGADAARFLNRICEYLETEDQFTF